MLQASSLKPQGIKLGISLFLIACSLWPVACDLLYSQDDYLEVKGGSKVETVTLSGNTSGFPAAPVRGEICYNSSTKRIYCYNGSIWGNFVGVDMTLATKIVAASNSLLDRRSADYVCDGTADQVEIQQAIDALTAGGVVYLLEGTYNISGSINLDNTAPNDSGKAIIGAGSGTVLRVSGSSFNVINASGVNRILISQLMIDGNNIGSNNYGINFNSVTNSKIDKVWVEKMSYRGIFIGNSSNNNILSASNYRLNGGCGITIQQSSNNTITGNMLWSNSGHGIHIMREGDAPASNNTISSNNVFLNSLSGIMLEGSAAWTVSNNTISGNNVNSSGNDGISLTFSSNNTVTGNTVWSSTSSGIYLFNSSSNNTVTGNNVGGNSQRGIYLRTASSRNILSGNVIGNNGGSANFDGITIEDNCDNNVISSNRIFDLLPTTNGGNGINWSTVNCDNNYVVGNLIDGAGFTRLINDSGTNTRYTGTTKITLENADCPGNGCSYLWSGLTLPLLSPSSYLRLNPPSNDITLGNPAISDGKASGDILILENISPTYYVQINDNAGVRLGGTLGYRKLYQNDTLTLIWDGTTGITDWIEIGYADN